MAVAPADCTAALPTADCYRRCRAFERHASQRLSPTLQHRQRRTLEHVRELLEPVLHPCFGMPAIAVRLERSQAAFAALRAALRMRHDALRGRDWSQACPACRAARLASIEASASEYRDNLRQVVQARPAGPREVRSNRAAVPRPLLPPALRTSGGFRHQRASRRGRGTDQQSGRALLPQRQAPAAPPLGTRELGARHAGSASAGGPGRRPARRTLRAGPLRHSRPVAVRVRQCWPNLPCPSHASPGPPPSGFRTAPTDPQLGVNSVTGPTQPVPHLASLSATPQSAHAQPNPDAVEDGGPRNPLQPIRAAGADVGCAVDQHGVWQVHWGGMAGRASMALSVSSWPVRSRRAGQQGPAALLAAGSSDALEGAAMPIGMGDAVMIEDAQGLPRSNPIC